MLTRIDHVMICIPDLQQGIDTYTRLGFNVAPGGMHPGQGTHNAIAFHEEDYLELLSVRDRDEYLSGHPAGGLLEFLAQGGTALHRRAERRPRGRRGADAPARRRHQRAARRRARRQPARSWAGRPRLLVRVTRCRFSLSSTSHRCPSAARRRGRHASQRGAPWIACTLRWWTAAAAEIYSHVLGMPVPKYSAGRSSKRTWRCSTSGRRA